MDSRTAAHVLSQIAAYLELTGANRFKARAYQGAAKALLSLGADDIGPLYRSGELAAVPGLGPATLSVVRDLVETGESSYLEQLRSQAPEGVLEMVRVPGLTPARVHQLHAELGISTLEALEEAAQDGRLAKLPRWGPRTAEKILKGIAFVKSAGVLLLLPHALAEGMRLVGVVRQHPGVRRAELAGSLRRRREVVADVDVVAGCSGDPRAVLESFARAPGVSEASASGDDATRIRYVDGTLLDLRCVPDAVFPVALWRATGSDDHVATVRERLVARRLLLDGDVLRDADGTVRPVPDERALYEAAGLAWVDPELREGRGEVDRAAAGAMPRLVALDDIRGSLHNHSLYSDGRPSIAELAEGARARGWSYVGITDHSEAAFYAGGVSREKLRVQHDEIDELNARLEGVRVLKGVEADILPDGRLDYDAEVLSTFDYVIGSIHSRFAMGEAEMTARILAALDDPHLTVLGHPTGRLLLNREPYAVDVDAVLEKAAEVGAAVELNADPHRLDLDWRHVIRAKELGLTVEIGPDAHSVPGMDNMEYGVAMARKGWLEAGDVLNARSADDVVAFARARRTRGGLR